SGTFNVALSIPKTATAGAHLVRFITYVPPYHPTCATGVVTVTFTVWPARTMRTPTVAPAATATATATGTTSPTAVATPCVTATGTVQTPTTTATVTATLVPTETATATATMTPTATATRTPTATATRTPTRVPTRTPTRVIFPRTGSGGLLDDGDGGDGGMATGLIVAVVLLGAGVTSAGVLLARRRLT
ncbi:MAG: hypothetical protein ACRD1H_03375, partial [Vicinamibacterales bacterium]